MVDNNINGCVIEVYQKVSEDSFPVFCSHIAIAPPKNSDRMEWFVEKAVELGITHITTLICERSQRETLRQERIERVMISALKQSLRTRLPVFAHAVLFTDFIEQTRHIYPQKYIAYCGATQPIPLLEELFRNLTDAVVLIGPEGDFSPSEADMALANGYQVVSLGRFRLRTETAALKAAALIGE
jgi:16S rRNA (uracil1498-N3)-methyltransferase